jgi:gluconolactonase
MAISVDQFETYAYGLDHPEDLAFDAEGTLWAGGELGQIYRIPEKGCVEEFTNIGGFCLGLTFSATDELFVCNANWRVLLEFRRTESQACLPILPAITN